MNFEISWLCPSRISSKHLQMRFLEEAIFFTSTHHLCAQSCYFNGTSNAAMTLITIDTSGPIFGSAGFPMDNGFLWWFIQYSVVGSDLSIFQFILCVVRLYYWWKSHLPRVILQGSPILNFLPQGVYIPSI